MLMLKEGLSIRECNNSMREDWAYAAMLITTVVETCVRHHILHHAGACCHESSLTEHMLCLAPEHTASKVSPNESPLLKLLHR
jgi:hypothetical protein